MESQAQAPFYQKLSFNLISIAILCLALFFGKDIILPVLFAILLANILLPVHHFLLERRVPKILAIFLPVALTIIVGGGILYFLSVQVINFMDDVPALKERFSEVSASFQKWINENTHITVRKQNQYINQTVEDLKDQGPKIVGMTFVSVTSVLTYVFLLPFYTFLILFYKSNIKTFLITTFKNGSEKRVTEVLNESTDIAQNYVTGLLIETALVFALNTIGFLILGIKYAVFLALLAALLNLIPYVGMLVANMICMIVTLVSSDTTSDVLWVGIILAFVQFVDNNFGMPLIVGNKVRINALVTIIGVLVGGALCGIPGMFLAIPALAVVKVICDKIPELNAWGVLLGDNSTGPDKKIKLSLLKSKKKQ
jgi:predicted PurR-regulated permease PerM